MASGSSNGSVHVWRVDYVTRAGGMPDKYTGFQGTLTAAPMTTELVRTMSRYQAEVKGLPADCLHYPLRLYDNVWLYKNHPTRKKSCQNTAELQSHSVWCLPNTASVVVPRKHCACILLGLTSRLDDTFDKS